MGGLGVFVRDCMAEMAKNHEVTIIGYDPMTLEPFKGTVNGCTVINCRSTNTQYEPSGAYHTLSLLDMMIENLLYHLRGKEFDIVHLHDTLLWPIAKYASILFKAPIVTHAHLSHALVHSGYPFTPQKIYEVTQEAHAYLMPSAVITCSKSYREELKKYFMLDRHIEIATNGVNAQEIFKYCYDPALNAEIGKGRPVIGFVGRMVPSKGVQHIIKLAKEFDNLYFLVISNVAPSVEKFHPLVADIKEAEATLPNIRWMKDLPSNSPEKWKLMASCDAAVIPSEHEPWGIVTDEWGILGVPKFVSRTGGLIEHNDDGDSIMIEPGENGLRQALIQFSLRGAPMFGHRMLAARDLSMTRTWKRTAEKVETVYTRIVNGRNN
jgi:glycosyltransferase involved in cell wall biosynthesis